MSQEAELEKEESKPKKKRKLVAKCWDPKYQKKSKAVQAGHSWPVCPTLKMNSRNFNLLPGP